MGNELSIGEHDQSHGNNAAGPLYGEFCVGSLDGPVTGAQSGPSARSQASAANAGTALQTVSSHDSSLSCVDFFLRMIASHSSGTSVMSATMISQQISPLLLTSDTTLGSLHSAIVRGFQGHQQSVTQLYPRRSPQCPRPRLLALSLHPQETVNTGLSPRKSFLRVKKPALLSKQEPSSAKIRHAFTIEEFKCPICLDVFDRPVATKCRHVFCMECIITSLVRQSICPLCRAKVYTPTLRSLADAANDKVLGEVYQEFQCLVVQCPKCYWVGEMRFWEDHVGHGYCTRAVFNTKPICQRVTLANSDKNPSHVESSSRSGELSCVLEPDTPSIGFQLGRQKPRFPSHILPRTLEVEPQAKEPFSESAALSSTLHFLPSGPSCCSRISEPVSRVSCGPSTQSSESNFRESEQGLLQNAAPRSENASLFPTDALAVWLIDHNPGAVIQMYAIAHRMENTAGALGGLVYSGIYHAEAVLEFERCLHDSESSPSSCSTRPQEPTREEKLSPSSAPDTVKTFLSMEIFSDRPGVQWKLFDAFPPLKSTAREVSAYRCPSPVHSSVIVHFLLSCRSRKYSLVNWNCQRFIASLRRVVVTKKEPATLISFFVSLPGASAVPCSVRSLPRPKSYSDELMVFLERLTQLGDVPIISSTQFKQAAQLPWEDSDASGSPPSWLELENNSQPSPVSRSAGKLRRWGSSLLSFKRIRRHGRRRRSLSLTESAPSSPVILGSEHCLRVYSVTLCVFPAEDLNRACLRPAAQLEALLHRTFGSNDTESSKTSAFADHHPYMCYYGGEDAALASSSQVVSREGEKDLHESKLVRDNRSTLMRVEALNHAQIRLRCKTFPILLFEIQKQTQLATQNESLAATLGYLSLEFRSDHGLWWHWYPEYPPGLRTASLEEGGTNIVLSSQVCFSLETLCSSLERVKEKEYHPTRWAGWDFAEAVLRACCPSVASDLLVLPIAESLP